MMVPVENLADESDRLAVSGPSPLVGLVEPVRRALVSAYGPELGAEAAADALAWGVEHQDRLLRMRNPGGYLFRVGQSSARRRRQRVSADWVVTLATHVSSEPLMESRLVERAALVSALRLLTERQRTAVLLVVAYRYSLEEAASTLGCTVSSLRNHVRRGLSRLRRALEES